MKRCYLHSMRNALQIALSITLLSAPFSVHAQAGSQATIQQIPTYRATSTAASNTNVAPVRGGHPSAQVQEAVVGPAVSPAALEACRAAQAADRASPKGVDCIGAMQARAPASQQSTAEGTLLQLLGQRSDLTGTLSGDLNGSPNADVAARELATGQVQYDSAGGAAAVIARQRATLPGTPGR